MYETLKFTTNKQIQDLKRVTQNEEIKWNLLFQKTESCVICTLNQLKNATGQDPFVIGKLYYDLSWMQNREYFLTGKTIYLKKYYYNYLKIREMRYFSIKSYSSDKLDTVMKYMSRFLWCTILMRNKSLSRDIIVEWGDMLKNMDNKNRRYYEESLQTINEYMKSIDYFFIYSASKIQSDTPTFRLSPTFKSFVKSNTSLILKETIIIANKKDKNIFEGRTPDMLHLSQMFEYDFDLSPCSIGHNDSKYENENNKSEINKNPRKRSLYLPNVYQFWNSMSRSCINLKNNEALLVYISENHINKFGKYKPNISGNSEDYNINEDQIYCFQPKDLRTYLRRPTLLIIDSPNSTSFKKLTSMKKTHFLCLMSPEAYINNKDNKYHQSSIFTRFMTCSISGLYLLCSTLGIKNYVWNSLQLYLEEFEMECLKLLSVYDDLKPFLSDPFLSRAVIRYCFLFLVLRYCNSYKSDKMPSSNPPTLDRVLITKSEKLKAKLKDLVNNARLTKYFSWDREF